MPSLVLWQLDMPCFGDAHGSLAPFEAITEERWMVGGKGRKGKRSVRREWRRDCSRDVKLIN